MNTSDSLTEPLISNPEEPSSNSIDAPPPTRAKKILRGFAWFFYGFFCLTLFTIMKLPDDRIKSYVDSQISAQLAPKGITYSSTESDLSFLFGLKYTMKGVTLIFPPPSTTPAKIDKIVISPSLLSLLIGRMGGGLDLYQGDGSLSSSFSIKDSKISLSFNSKKLDLGKLGLLPLAANIQGSALLNGNGSVSGDLNNPSTLEGGISIQLSRVLLDQQSIMGFSIPRIGISEGVIDLDIGKAKATIKTFRLGKPGNAADDIQGNVTGDITLAKSMETSNLNLKIKFSLSEGIMKAFILLDAILGAGKQADGSYAFNLSGPLMAPFPTPLTAGQ